MAWSTTPRPVQVGQAPAGLLNENVAIAISGTGAAQCGHGTVGPASGASSGSPAGSSSQPWSPSAPPFTW